VAMLRGEQEKIQAELKELFKGAVTELINKVETLFNW